MTRTSRLELIAVAWMILATLIACAASPAAPMPQCPEDAVLVGSGDFTSGRWSAYSCGPAVDDYTEGTNR